MIRAPRLHRERRRWPWVTLGILALASLAAVLPGAESALEYHRSAIRAGEPWRLLSGQLVHWTPRMALADLSVLLALGGWLEILSRRLVVTALLAGAVCSGLGLYWLSPEMAVYRGSSSLASALFVAALVVGGSGRWERIASMALLGLFGMKLLWEMQTGQALCAGELLPGVQVAPAAHLFGGLGGFLAAVASGRSFGRPEAPVARRRLALRRS